MVNMRVDKQEVMQQSNQYPVAVLKQSRSIDLLAIQQDSVLYVVLFIWYKGSSAVFRRVV